VIEGSVAFAARDLCFDKGLASGEEIDGLAPWCAGPG
jgi:hypothetical protein